MKKGLFIITLLALGLLLPVHGLASITYTINPTADAFVHESAPTSNYGSIGYSLLVSKVLETGQERWTYLKFSLNSLQGVAPADISSVTLGLWVNTTAGGMVEAYHSLDTWTESGITWNNKPAISDLMGTSPNLTPNSQYYTINLLDGGKGWLSGDLNLSDGYLSVALKLPSNVNSGAYYFNNREWTNPPYLKVEVVPIPGAVWLFGSGLIGLIGVRRFRK